MNFWCWRLQQATKIEQKSMKNRMFFGTSILDRFWEGFGRGLGGQNPWFSHFFRCFFEVVFTARLGRAKNRPKRPCWGRWTKFWTWIPVIPPLLGREKERGSRAWACIKSLTFQIRHLWLSLTFSWGRLVYGLARPAPPSVGGGLNSPRGGPPPPPHLCARMLGDCHALKACICRTALLKAHGEMKAHILATICPDFAMNLRRW